MSWRPVTARRARQDRRQHPRLGGQDEPAVAVAGQDETARTIRPGHDDAVADAHVREWLAVRVRDPALESPRPVWIAGVDTPPRPFRSRNRTSRASKPSREIRRAAPATLAGTVIANPPSAAVSATNLRAVERASSLPTRARSPAGPTHSTRAWANATPDSSSTTLPRTSTLSATTTVYRAAPLEAGSNIRCASPSRSATRWSPSTSIIPAAASRNSNWPPCLRERRWRCRSLWFRAMRVGAARPRHLRWAHHRRPRHCQRPARRSLGA